MGDGHISKKGHAVRLFDADYHFVVSTLKQCFIQSFGEEPAIYNDKSNNSYHLYRSSKTIWTELHELGVPSGRKARIITIPETVQVNNPVIKAHFLSGVFDAEGSITRFKETKRHPRGYSYFQLKMFNPRFVLGLMNLLLDISSEFVPKVYNYGDWSVLRLNGRGQLKLVSRHLFLRHPRLLRALGD